MHRLTRLLVVAALVAGAACSSGGKRTEGAAAETTTTTAATTTTTEAPTTTTAEATTTTAAPPPATTAKPPASAPPAASPGGLTWKACGALQCASLAVPRDYADPSGPTLTLALARKPARTPAARISSLLINPGGPGNSGVSGLPNELRSLTPTLQNRFDIVSWDPRGIQRSAPVRCSDPNAKAGGGGGGSGSTIDPAPTRPEDQQVLAEAYRAAGEACLRWSGDLLRHVGTDSTAEDLERIRIALGEEKLTFIGHSAGTLIGAVYADRYPDRVRAFVLDGPIDPSLTLDQMTLAQAKGFEAALRSFFAWCDKTATCKWRPANPDRTQAYLALMDRIRQQPLKASGGRIVGVDTFVSGTMSRLTARSKWPSLGDALAAAERGDGSPLATLASNYQNAGATNAADARQSILCLDHPAPRELSAYPPLAEASKAHAPVFGPVFTWAALSCGMWPVPSTLEAKPTRAPGAPPILVIGTTGDPATPQVWGEALAGQLERGVFLLRQGAEHVAYYYSACVRRHVDAYIVDGRPPASGTVCAS
ncbi:MAG TPA: alpha/beta hydrolase [Acidimicrobiia bacterium]|nr:alpha/beta hydrolase [Acidimicrobiia bacterium]